MKTMSINQLSAVILLVMIVSFSQAEQISNSFVEVTYLPNNPEVKRGDSKEQVDQLLGTSKGWKADNEETAYYERGFVQFRDGKAVKWSILSDTELLRKKEREQSDNVYTISSVPIRVLTPKEQERNRKQEAERRQADLERQKQDEIRRSEEEQQQKQKRQQEEQKVNDSKVVSFLEFVITSQQIQLSAADLLRSDFLASINAKQIKSVVVSEWADDPIKWQNEHSYEIQNAKNSSFYSDNSSYQCLHYALNRFDARQQEMAENERQKNIEQIKLILINKVLNPPQTQSQPYDNGNDLKINQIHNDIQQMKIRQGIP
jgi:hypothetical protein